MSCKLLSPHAALATLALAGLLIAGEPRPAPPPGAGDPAWRLSGPFTEGNLTVYLVHGPDQTGVKDVLTLDEALSQKKAVVHETQNVNQLQVENLSPDHGVFIQAGDIVKGGQQDRTLAHDMIIPPKSGKVALACFCVEAGRWTRRGAEDARQFNASKDNLATNAQKIAARQAMKQGEVWEKVAKAQADLSKNLKAEVRAAESQSSLQLTLENKKVLEAIDVYVRSLRLCGRSRLDAIGYVACINGKVNNADVYATHALFEKLWPKLLKASAVEAVAELQKGKKFDAPSADGVRAFLAEAGKGKWTQKDVTPRLKESVCENAKSCQFVTRDGGKDGSVLRRSYVKK
jgi:hypothetical protein